MRNFYILILHSIAVSDRCIEGVKNLRYLSQYRRESLMSVISHSVARSFSRPSVFPLRAWGQRAADTRFPWDLIRDQSLRVVRNRVINLRNIASTSGQFFWWRKRRTGVEWWTPCENMRQSCFLFISATRSAWWNAWSSHRSRASTIQNLMDKAAFRLIRTSANGSHHQGFQVQLGRHSVAQSSHTSCCFGLFVTKTLWAEWTNYRIRGFRVAKKYLGIQVMKLSSRHD